jgi:hypothetical protein
MCKQTSANTVRRSLMMEMDRQHGQGITYGRGNNSTLTSLPLYKRLDYKTCNTDL